jgi:hypothetical protein
MLFMQVFDDYFCSCSIIIQIITIHILMFLLDIGPKHMSQKSPLTRNIIIQGC